MPSAWRRPRPWRGVSPVSITIRRPSSCKQANGLRRALLDRIGDREQARQLGRRPRRRSRFARRFASSSARCASSPDRCSDRLEQRAIADRDLSPFDDAPTPPCPVMDANELHGASSSGAFWRRAMHRGAQRVLALALDAGGPTQQRRLIVDPAAATTWVSRGSPSVERAGLVDHQGVRLAAAPRWPRRS